MKIAICDDDIQASNIIESYLKRIQIESKDAFKMSINIYDSGEAFYESCESGHDFDILFLDVEMSGMTGIDLAQIIRHKRNYDTQIVFISDYPEYMKSSFNVEAFDYMSKPVKYDEFLILWKRIIKRINRDSLSVIEINTSEQTEIIKINSISYAQVSKEYRGYIDLHPFGNTSEKKRVKSSLKELSEILCHHNFAQCSKDTLVNIKYIYKIKKPDIILKDNCSIKLSRHYERSFREYLSKNTLKMFRG